MAKKIFTEKQREIIARKLGYDGPMSEFDKFVRSDPAMEQKVKQLAVKLVANGGFIKKFAAGGLSTEDAQKLVQQLYGDILGRSPDKSGQEFYIQRLQSGVPLEQIRSEISSSPEAKARVAKSKTAKESAGMGGQDLLYRGPGPGATGSGAAPPPRPRTPDQEFPLTKSGPPTSTDKITAVNARATTPAAATRPAVSPTKVSAVSAGPGQDAKYTAATAKEAAASAAEVQQTTAPERTEFTPIQAAKTKAEIDAITAANKAIVGTVSDKAQAVAAEMTPTETALMNMEAARLANPREVVGAPIRELQAEELVSGPAVNMANVEATLNKTVAATAAVTPEMTVQGQLDKLLTDFDAGNPPSWAASSLRNANSVLAARGLGASSLAGQAIIQATLEAAVPLAAQDAQTTAALEMQNLSNRQQTAVLVAQQRAAFLGQSFDQEFQARVTNAARIADIANQNFSAGVQIALENARLAQTVDLANLTNEQAIVMAQAGQIGNLETTNLSNRQQAAVQNAQAFLQMDLTNVNNAQQTAMMNAQARIQSAFTDAAAENATRQFNASSGMQVDQFYSSLSAQVGQFNTAQANAMAQFNVNQSNALSQFNTAQSNAMSQFNSQNRLVVDQSNAEWRRNIATINTAAQNNANMFDAQANLQITMAEYNNQWQSTRDTMEYAFKSGESFLDRQNTLAIAVLQKDAAIEAAEKTAKGRMYESLGNLTANVLSSTDIASDLYKAGKSIFSDLTNSGLDEGFTGSISADVIADLNLKSGNLYGDLGNDVGSMDWMFSEDIPDYYDVGDFPTGNFDTFGGNTSIA